MKMTSMHARSRWRRRHAVMALPLLAIFLLLAPPSAQTQTFVVLHTFTGKADGKYPEARVLFDNAGTLYSTTLFGGAFDYGTVFQIDAHGKKTVLHNFWGGDGLGPEAGLIRDNAGNLYGTTYRGGTPKRGRCQYGCGTVFKLDTTGKLTVLHAFTGGTDGGQPEFGLVQDEAGNLYGTTTVGGNLSCSIQGFPGCGVAFKIDKKGKETVLHAFAGTDGSWPSGDLIRDSEGNLYGITSFGGAFGGTFGWGTVFKLDPSGRETVLHNFTGGIDGGYPDGPLVRDEDGNLYGTAGTGGASACSCGLVFMLDKTGKITVLYSFHGSPDGAYPSAGVTRDQSGTLYGTTWRGGTTGCYNIGCGTVFKLDTSGNETVLHAFTGGSDGAVPTDGIVLDESGSLYGTAPNGGGSSCGGADPGCGVIFKLTP